MSSVTQDGEHLLLLGLSFYQFTHFQVLHIDIFQPASFYNLQKISFLLLNS